MDLALTIERTGTFAVHWSGSNASQCGIAGTRVLHYTVRIGCGEQHLNPHGFIIDNNDIHAYFDRTYQGVRDFESCERIAAKACKDFHATLDESGVEPTFIEVTISGNPAAGLTASWRAPVEAKPERAQTTRRKKQVEPKEVPHAVAGLVEVPGMPGVKALDPSAFTRR